MCTTVAGTPKLVPGTQCTKVAPRLNFNIMYHVCAKKQVHQGIAKSTKTASQQENCILRHTRIFTKQFHQCMLKICTKYSLVAPGTGGYMCPRPHPRPPKQQAPRASIHSTGAHYETNGRKIFRMYPGTLLI